MPLVNVINRNQTAEGRLTLASNTPVTTTDQTAKSTVYYTPYVGNRIALYNGVSWDIWTFSEISIAVPSTTTTPFDIWAYNNGGVVTLETLDWTNDTTRATALAFQDGVLVKSGTPTRRYLGTGRTTGSSGQTESSVAKRFLWNFYNRVPLNLRVVESDVSWTYSSTTLRSANNDTTNRIELVVGYTDTILRASVFGKVYSDVDANGHARLGEDSTTTDMGGSVPTHSVTAPGQYESIQVHYNYPIAVAGYHFYQWLEAGQGSGTQTFYGEGSSGILATLNG